MKPVTKKTFRCPECGAELPPDLVAEIKAAGVSDFHRAAGRAVTEKKRAAQRRNMAAVNASYTPEKRRLAAAKRKAKKAERAERRLRDVAAAGGSAPDSP
ncbi:MAG: hypothetical protein IJU70_11435 [Lentisphaeria bacterium]|nr:hypothetical protein [Lentisphaeria bacterium]